MRKPSALAASSQTTLRQHTLSYLEHLTATDRSARTVEAYGERLRPFVTWCEQRGVTLAAQVNRLTAIRSLLRWLLQRHHILYNPSEQLVLPKVGTKLPAQVLSVEETEAVLDAQDTQTLTGLRNRAVLEMLWSTGLRRSELANLLRVDVDVGRGGLVVRQGKGRKDRVVPVGMRALVWTQRYLDAVRPRLTSRHDSGYLFATIHGRKLGRSTLTQLAGNAIRREAKLEKAGACHLFRHSMATQMLENGADTRHIQAILGHEKLETTQIYTRVAIGHLKKVHERTHPAERKRKPRRKKTTRATPDKYQKNEYD
ncbi:recombinase XerD [Brenneria roseae subsp. roseae]|uniref:site-specific tyrosine recombinase XerC n=1 Tax=Brenneria roseae TaxID=1509241 RepID=UPI000D60AEC2|nr:site-specific tyrosine recombinase XerC [Brenneria roseae]PWC16564.1 recombinase XerD [Brenneria roseae subsp. roseae]